MADWIVKLAEDWGAWMKWFEDGPSIEGTMGRVYEEGGWGAASQPVAGHKILAKDMPRRVHEFHMEWLMLPDLQRQAVKLYFAKRGTSKHKIMRVPRRTFYNLKNSGLDRLRGSLDSNGT